MGTAFQVTFDCINPDHLARFWAQVLGYKMQDPPKGFANWIEFLTVQGIPEEDWNDRSAIIDPDGRGSRVYFQKVFEPKTVKNRVHLDINVSQRGETPEERKETIQREAERLTALGATKLRVFDESGEFWIHYGRPRR